MADIDARFGLTAEAADAALREAFDLWRGRQDGVLFTIDEAGHPISFVFDERQESAQRRKAEREAAAAIARELESMRVAFEALRSEVRSAATGYEGVVAAHRARTESLNAEIIDWNQRGGTPDSVRTRLDGEREILAEQGGDLARRREGIQQGNDDLMTESQRLNQRIEDYNRAQERLGGAAVGLSQAGRYDEEITTRAGRVEDIRRQIRVFRYDSPRDLVVVLAHELGHALGLGHAGVSGAVMSEVSTFGDGEAQPRLHSRDVEMLQTKCPGLRGPEVDLGPR